jgi:hypothetical protein
MGMEQRRRQQGAYESARDRSGGNDVAIVAFDGDQVERIRRYGRPNQPASRTKENRPRHLDREPASGIILAGLALRQVALATGAACSRRA